MSFRRIPTMVRIPKFPGWNEDDGYGPFATGGVLISNEYRPTNESWMPPWFVAYWHSSLGYIIAEDFCYSIMDGGTELRPIHSECNGWGFFSSDTNDWNSPAVWYTNLYGWVYASSGLQVGVEPEEFEDEIYGWRGDTFYSLDIGNPQPNGASITATPRGAIHKTGSAKYLSTKFKYWSSPNQFGNYSPSGGGASGTKRMGLPSWNGAGRRFVRSLRKGDDGKYNYGPVRYSEGAWRLGNLVGSEPVPNQSVTFSDPAGIDPPVTLSWGGYVLGDDAEPSYIADVQVFR